MWPATCFQESPEKSQNLHLNFPDSASVSDSRVGADLLEDNPKGDKTTDFLGVELDSLLLSFRIIGDLFDKLGRILMGLDTPVGAGGSSAVASSGSSSELESGEE